MKIYGNPNKLGGKSEGIQILYNFDFHIPQTWIYSLESFKKIKKISPKDTCLPLYIIRPSYIGEDSHDTSSAGKFNSIGPISYKKLLEISQYSKSCLQNEFNGKGSILGSIIVQEFIDTNIYGVAFSKNPQNLLLPGSYEIGKTFNSITGGNQNKHDITLSIFLKIKLCNIIKKIEKLTGFPQDIEFAVKKNKIIILQSRDITTGNISFPSYEETKNITGIYRNIDNGEFGHIKIFSASLLEGIIAPLHIGGKLYGKNQLGDSVKKEVILNNFTQLYKNYLRKKSMLSFFQKIIFWQNLDKNYIRKLYQSYYYSFDIFTPSNINLDFSGSTNIKTKLLLLQEKHKNNAFTELEKIKNIILTKNSYGKDLRYLTFNEWNNSDLPHLEIINKRKNATYTTIIQQKNIFLYQGKIVNYKKNHSGNKHWIYKGIIGKNSSTKKSFKKGDVLVIDSLGDDISDYLDSMSGLIAKKGSIYSHNAILLREYKIPSFIDIS